MHQMLAPERCSEAFDQALRRLVFQNDSDHDAISTPFNPFGRAVQPYGRPVPRGVGSREAGHEVRLLAEIIEQFLPQFAASDQRQAHMRDAHGSAFATPPPPKRR